MKSLKWACLSGLVLFALATSPAQAIQYITGHVTLLEPTYMPGHFVLQMDAGNAACPAGKWLIWKKANAENVRATYATVLAALQSGKAINFIINDNDTTCEGQFLHIGWSP